ncbi:MAG: vitamin K epoxide reductase family protein [Armatimonadota bacterium]|nr:vitamin K epoxide reductase family protein [Armatimonadota bacterium]MDR7443125.1 vitamin K epoxide reductase family protein [Armatimonadota bacterium]MDR7569604.1 vitamin K epoxide reductase family protein [Armatimonadota bacterium]MDR7614658.1 vitamin K epoxide reductase family protein [Armatimonadota bacterium]
MGAGTGRSGNRLPVWPLGLLAAAGFLLSGYLWFGTGGAELRFCPAGSGCQVVQSSRYASLLGVPLPVYGLVYYGVLLVVSGWGTDPGRRWQLALVVSAAGSAASLVFLGVQRFLLETFCALCVLSALLSFAVLGLSWKYGRAGVRWPALAVPAVAALAFVVGGYAIAERQVAATAYAEGLARHLAASGAKFYGAYWCPHCAEQKRMFGEAARYLPYVECDPRSPEGNPRACEAAGVRAYPTWIIRGRRYEGVIPLEELARLSGYPPP